MLGEEDFFDEWLVGWFKTDLWTGDIGDLGVDEISISFLMFGSSICWESGFFAFWTERIAFEAPGLFLVFWFFELAFWVKRSRIFLRQYP